MYTSQLKPVIQIKKYIHKPENFETHNHYISCFIHICFYIIYIYIYALCIYACLYIFLALYEMSQNKLNIIQKICNYMLS